MASTTLRLTRCGMVNSSRKPSRLVRMRLPSIVDHLGTPQELTVCEGKVAWSVQYKAGGAKEAISDAAPKAGIRNPIRFQGQTLMMRPGCFTADIGITIRTAVDLFRKID